jgi:hypothetical protein
MLTEALLELGDEERWSLMQGVWWRFSAIPLPDAQM